MPTNLKLIENVLAYELVRRALLTRAILAFFPPLHHLLNIVIIIEIIAQKICLAGHYYYT